MIYIKNITKEDGMKFKFKKDAEPIETTDDFFYMLFYGGYIKPEEYLEDVEQIKKLNEAISLLYDFRDDFENSGLFIEC